MQEMINKSNSHIFDELAQDYEDEFSLTSKKKKNQDEKYSTDVDWRTPNVGYYWKEGSKIVGFSIIEPIDGYSEIIDFLLCQRYLVTESFFDSSHYKLFDKFKDQIIRCVHECQEKFVSMFFSLICSPTSLLYSSCRTI